MIGSNNKKSILPNDIDSFWQDVFWIGLREGFKSTLRIVKIMIPVSLIITILKYLGFIKLLSEIVSPYCGILGLRGECILALLSGFLINCNSAIAVMATLSLSAKEITILSTMILLSHTLPIELAVQKKGGGSFLLILIIRLSSSLLMGLVLNWIIPNDTNSIKIDSTNFNIITSASFSNIMLSWILGQIEIVKIIIINLIVIVFYRLFKRYKIIDFLSDIFKYILFIFGLPKEAAPLWIVINFIGLMYGSSMLIEAKNNKCLKENDLKKLNISVATCHSIIQEPVNFIAIGASVPFLIIPRFVISIFSVWIYNLYLFFIGRIRSNLHYKGVSPL